MILAKHFRKLTLIFVLILFGYYHILAQTTYYSVSETNPHNFASWNTARDGSGAAPADFTSGDIFIVQGTGGQSGAPHDVIVSTSFSITGANAQFTIETGASLTVNAARTFTVDNATGKIDVYGTVINQNEFNALNGATIEFHANSKYEHQRNGGTVRATIWDPTSTCEITGTTTTRPTFINTVTYGNVIWNCAGQTQVENAQNLKNIAGDFTVQNTGTSYMRFEENPILMTTGGSTFTINAGATVEDNGRRIQFSNAAGGNAVINGTFRIGNGNGFSGAGSATIESDNNPVITCGASSTIIYYRTNTQTVRSSCDLQDLQLLGTNVKTLGNSFTVKGDLTIDAGITEFAMGNNDLTVNGDVISNQTVTAGTGELILSGGTVAHNISGTGGVFGNLTLNDANGAILASDASVTGELKLTTGSFTVGSNVLTLAATIAGTPNNIVTNASSELVINGGFAAMPSSITTIKNLTFNSAGGTTLAADLSVEGTLTLSAGNFNVSTRTLTLKNPIAGTTTNLQTTTSSNITIAGTAAGINLPSSVANLGNLVLNNVNGTTLQADLFIEDDLTLTAGRLIIGNFDITLSDNSDVLGTPSSTNMVITNGTGLFIREFNGNDSFTFPIGENTGSIDYSPVDIQIGGGGGGYGAIGFRVVNAKDPNNTSGTDYLNRYWVAESSGAWGGGKNVDVTCNYMLADVMGTAGNISGAYYSGGSWTSGAAIGGNTFDFNNLVITTVLPANFTGIDTKAPSIIASGIVPNLTEIEDANAGGNNFTVAVTWDEEMDPTVTPTISFPNEDPTATIAFQSGAWSNGNKTYTATYFVTDVNDDIADIDITASLAEDLAGNLMNAPGAAITQNLFDIRMDNPAVVSLTTSTALVTDGTAAFSIEVEYDEAMNTGVQPVITFPNENPAPTLTSSTSGWSNGDKTYTLNYTIADNDLNMSNIDVRVTGGENTFGNAQAQYDASDKFSIDMQNATVLSVTPSTTVIKDVHAGGTFTLTLVYDKTMNTGIKPTISFPTGGENPAGTITYVNGSSNWSNNTTFVATYNVFDSNNEILNIDVRVTGAEDANGNTQDQADEINNFSIDTENPSIVSINTSTATITDGLATFNIIITYDQDMNTGIAPNVSFPVENPLSTISFASGSWTSNTVYQANYNVVDADQQLLDVDITATTAQDPNGNVMNAPGVAITDDKFDIRMNNPTVVNLTTSTTTITDGTVAFSIEVTYSEAMNPGVQPVISFPGVGENPAPTLTAGLDGWTVGNTVYTLNYTIADNDLKMQNIDVRVTGGESSYGNTQTQFDVLNKFNIDMKNATVTAITPSSATITDANVGAGGFTLTLTYDKNMDTGIKPTITFPASNPLGAPVTLNYVAASSTWTNATTFVATYNVVDNNVDYNAVDVRVVGADDADGNAQTQADFGSNFAVDTDNPDVSSVTTSTGTIVEGDVSFVITINYNENMNTSVAPAISFPVENPLSTLTFNSGTWASATQYQATYTVTDANQMLNNIDIRIINARDIDGNTQNQHDEGNEFNIRMQNPSVSNLTTNLANIADADAGNQTFTITIDFSENMDMGIAPAITFPVENPLGTITLDPASGWSSNTRYIARYDVADNGEYVQSIDIRVDNAENAAGNPQTQYNVADKFNIDMSDPQLSAIEVANIAYTENDAATLLTSNILITDAGGQISTATIQITGNYQNGEDLLAYTNTPPISGVFVAGTGTLTLTGPGTVAQFQTALRSVRYQNTSDDPSGLTRTVSLTVNDGVIGNSNTVTRDIDVTPVNDLPTFTSTAITVGREGEVYTYNMAATDIETADAALDFTLISRPAAWTWLPANGTNLGTGTGTLTGTPPLSTAPLTGAIKIRVTDGDGGTTDQDYTIVLSSDIIVDAGGGADYTTIQAAIDAAVDGDKISVVDGTYNENIDFKGKEIDVVGNIASPSSVIINGDGTSSVVTFKTGENNNSKLRGFRITGGTGTYVNLGTYTKHSRHASHGGGIYIFGSSPVIENCEIMNNTANASPVANEGGSGGGIYIGNGGNPIIRDTKIASNTAVTYRGGAIAMDQSTVNLENVDISSNIGGDYGGGIAAFNSTLNISLNTTITGNTITGNNGLGGGLYLNKSTLNYQNTTITGNTATNSGQGIYAYSTTLNSLGGTTVDDTVTVP